jgi:hypothetical protein
MTCDEYREMTDSRGVWECTHAEVHAAMNHMGECEACVEYSRERAKKSEEALGQFLEGVDPRLKPLFDLFSDVLESVAGRATKQKLAGMLNDPETRG